MEVKGSTANTNTITTKTPVDNSQDTVKIKKPDPKSNESNTNNTKNTVRPQTPSSREKDKGKANEDKLKGDIIININKNTSKGKPKPKNAEETDINLAVDQGIGTKIKLKTKINDKITNMGGNEEVKTNKTNIKIQDLEAIKQFIQEITKNANPMGKLIDFLPDDIESMNKELQTWIKQSKEYTDKLEEEMK